MSTYNDVPMNVIDTSGSKKHIRHLTKAQIGDSVKTQCGRIIKYFWDASQVSYFYTDGSRYSMPCRRCLPEDYEKAVEMEEKAA
jgi:hypothetical protein